MSESTEGAVTLQQRKELLRGQLRDWAGKGYVIEDSGETHAQLTIDPPMGCLGAVLVFFTFGLGRVFWRMFNPPHQVFVDIDEDGTVNVAEKLPIYPMN